MWSEASEDYSTQCFAYCKLLVVVVTQTHQHEYNFGHTKFVRYPTDGTHLVYLVVKTICEYKMNSY